MPDWASSPFAQRTTLLQLVTHTSGLPRLPNNIKQTVQNKLDPYANYTEQHMTEAILSESAKDKRSFNYSNYGYGLLGLSLSKRLGKSLHDAMAELIFEPLRMNFSGLTIDNIERKIPVYSYKGIPTPHWNFQDATVGAGGICSTITDMLQYLEAHLGLHTHDMDCALARCHNEHFAIRPKRGIGIGYGWLRYKEKDSSVTHWHNGGTYGSNSYASFNREHGIGLVILSNYGHHLRSNLPLLGAGKINVDKIANQLNEAIFT